ncbi:unnamed protein product [Echinostoma caproni]|uniref:Multidrug resistance protein, MATE family n=1 Tax=Echinostoma caproni TaxID=27848 RepID=A0A183A8F5_9TREM|nr:unnamed protein product [Echinostoma caproni]
MSSLQFWGLEHSSRQFFSSIAVAQGISYLIENICFLIFIRYSKSVVKIRLEFSRCFLEDWGVWFRLAIPGIIMVSMEWTLFEIGQWVAGSLGAHELSVQTVLTMIDAVSYSLLPYGIGSATGIRVGQYLGAGDAAGPRTAFSVALLVMCELLIFIKPS